MKEVQLKYEYWKCQFNAKDTQDLDNHITGKHAVDKSFILPISTEEFGCPGCNSIFLADHNFDRHVYKDHMYSFTCRHCNKHLSGGDEMAGVYKKIS